MDTDSWRERLKSGPTGGLYALARRLKRRLRGEPIAGHVPTTFPTLALSELLALPTAMPENARVYYSQARAWLETDSPGAARRALACLRCAEALPFESVERVTLYKSLALARCGDATRSIQLASTLESDDLTVDEDALRTRLLNREIVPDSASDAPGPLALLRPVVEARTPESLLVVRDPDAETASWLPEASYVIAVPHINGLSSAALGRVKRDFSLGLGTSHDKQNVERAGVRCAAWLTVE
jgi:hypothetical protein